MTASFSRARGASPWRCRPRAARASTELRHSRSTSGPRFRSTSPRVRAQPRSGVAPASSRSSRSLTDGAASARSVLAGRYAFSEKARSEMEADNLTELDVAESIINAVAIYKRLRSRSRKRTRRTETLYVIQATNLEGHHDRLEREARPPTRGRNLLFPGFLEAGALSLKPWQNENSTSEFARRAGVARSRLCAGRGAAPSRESRIPFRASDALFAPRAGRRSTLLKRCAAYRSGLRRFRSALVDPRNAAQPAVGADRRATALLHACAGGRRPLNRRSLGCSPFSPSGAVPNQ